MGEGTLPLCQKKGKKKKVSSFESLGDSARWKSQRAERKEREGQMARAAVKGAKNLDVLQARRKH